MFKGIPIKIVLALAMILIKVPRRPTLIFKSLTRINAAIYEITTPINGKSKSSNNPIKLLLVRLFWTETKIDTGSAICVINLEILPENVSASQPFFLKIYPNTIINTITTTLDTDDRNVVIHISPFI